MAPRAVGALFALVAALLFMASLAGAVVPKVAPAWIDGHPTVGTKTLDRKAIHVGLLGAYGCNLGEQVTCESIDAGPLLQPIGIAELAALGLLALTTIAMLVSIWRIGDRRKGLGRIVVIETLIAAAIAGAWFAFGPVIKAGTSQVAVPIGIGLYAFGAGAAASLIAGLLALKVEREPLRLKSSQPRMAPMVAEPAYDVRELARPAAPIPHRPTPMPPMPPPPIATPPSAYPGLSNPAAYVPSYTSPGGALPGPAGALAPQQPIAPGTGPHLPVNSHPPLFEHAPQLRPLYDLGNVGVVPAPPPPQLPMRPPTPIPRASFAETTEFPTSASPPPTPPAPPSPPPPPPNAAPPARTKAASLPPSRAFAPPARKLGSGSAPERPMSKQPTIAHAIPPMPAPAPSTPTQPPPRVGTEPEPSTAVEVDAEAKAKWKAAQRTATPAPPPPAPVAAPTTPPIEAERAADTAETPVAEAPTEEATLLGPRAPIQRPATDEIETRAVERVSASTLPPPPAASSSPFPTAGPPPPNAIPAVTVDKADFDKTLDRTPPTRPSASSLLKPQPIVVPKIIVPKPAAQPKSEPKVEPPGPTPDPDAKTEIRVPISTAPASLPPPKKAAPQTSGPTPACPQCEAPMAWVEEHLRFYCAQCRMYF